MNPSISLGCMKETKKETPLICPVCKEAYAEKLGKVCISCQGKGYYTTFESHINECSEQ